MSTEKTFDADYPQIAALELDIDSGYCGNPVVDADDLSKALDKLRVEYDAVLARADLMDRLATGHQKEKHETQNRLADALARAEAAEDCQRETVAQSRPYILELQSRLAAATALLELGRQLYDGLITLQQFGDRYAARLSATPAQAAEPDMPVEFCDNSCASGKPCPAPVEQVATVDDTPEQTPLHLGTENGLHDPAQAAEPEPRRGYCAVHAVWKSGCDECALNPPEHPDTIALGACRAELERVREYNRAYDDLVQDLDPPDILVHWLSDRKALESARAERDTAEARIAELESQLSCVDEGAEQHRQAWLTAEARIAELEQINQNLREHHQARIAELEKRCAAYERGAADWLETQACVSRAVAELEKYTGAPGAHGNDFRVLAALEALR